MTLRPTPLGKRGSETKVGRSKWFTFFLRLLRRRLHSLFSRHKIHLNNCLTRARHRALRRCSPSPKSQDFQRWCSHRNNTNHPNHNTISPMHGGAKHANQKELKCNSKRNKIKTNATYKWNNGVRDKNGLSKCFCSAFGAGYILSFQGIKCKMFCQKQAKQCNYKGKTLFQKTRHKQCKTKCKTNMQPHSKKYKMATMQKQAKTCVCIFSPPCRCRFLISSARAVGSHRLPCERAHIPCVDLGEGLKVTWWVIWMI